MADEPSDPSLDPWLFTNVSSSVPQFLAKSSLEPGVGVGGDRNGIVSGDPGSIAWLEGDSKPGGDDGTGDPQPFKG